MYFIPFIGAFSLATIALMEKLVLRVRKLSIEKMQVYSFFASVIVMLPIIYFFWNIKSGAFDSKNILIFILIIIFSVIANLLAFYSLKGKELTNIEPARMLEPLFVVVLAIIFSFFSLLYDRNLNIIIPALIAVSALILSNTKRHHLHLDKYILAAIGGSFFFAVELILSRLILEFYSPISFYFLRNLAVLFLSFIIFKPKLKGTSSKIKREIFFIGFLWVVYRLAVYYGYIHVGVITTTLILLLAPVIIYFFAWKFLKEKPNWKNIISAIIILGCVFYVVVW